MTNNKRKMKHLVKFSRHWKFTAVMHLSKEEIEYAFHDSETHKQFVDNLYYRVVDKVTESIERWGFPWWKEIPKTTLNSIYGKYGYGYIKEDKPII